jgi:prepilin-type processing-associated H-X9-DG protein/prepilin-type N-terminal cleavage/methylation domain-containing protein
MCSLPASPQEPTPLPHRPTHAFTLVELLVVIGIIALLMAMLLPALGRARENANQLKCQAQQRQILQAMILHAAEHRGYMPLAGRPWAGVTPDALLDTRMQKYDYYAAGPGYHVMSLMGALAPQLNQDIRTDSLASVQEDIQRPSGVIRRIFVCPSDREGGRFGATVEGGGDGYNSYAFNEAALGWGDPGDGSGVLNHARLRGNSARFPHPASLMLLTDGAPRGGDGAGRWQVYYDHDINCTLRDVFITPNGGGVNPNFQPNAKDCGEWTLLDPTRHRNRMNVAFADGHVENVPLDPGSLDKISLDVDFPAN